MVCDAGKGKAKARFPFQCPSRVPRQQIDPCSAKRIEPLACGKRNEDHLRAVVEDRAGNGAAEIDVETGPVASITHLGKPEQSFAYSTLNDTTLPDALQSSG